MSETGKSSRSAVLFERAQSVLVGGSEQSGAGVSGGGR